MLDQKISGLALVLPTWQSLTGASKAHQGPLHNFFALILIFSFYCDFYPQNLAYRRSVVKSLAFRDSSIAAQT